MAESNNTDAKKQLSSDLFPVVGVGASAGGLEAFKRLIKAIPDHSGMAYILVQHLEPTHESLLPDLLQKITNIPINTITNNLKVKPDQIYIIPANKLLTANDGILQLSPRPAKNEKHMPIDVFFTSLAEVHQSHAIGVVLSGTATDGTLGLKAIKDHGGITFAQDQQSAAFDGMPQSAIDAEVVDFVLTPEEIPLQLAKLNQPFTKEIAGNTEEAGLTTEDAFRQLLTLLRIRRGVDFTYYKPTTIRRRIVRRMGLNKIETIPEYLSFFKENKPEQDILFQDLLIPVTSFFRDPEVYEVINDTLFPILLKDRDENNPLRIWIAGCSTGEEPYSMAVCLHEYLADKAVLTKIQIFATDISEKSIAKARTGLYSKKDIAILSASRLQKYFTKVNGNFQINKVIRDMCVFACHNFLKDPPFAKMDFISCRNVLIYMEPFLQKKALTTFHYALKENGYLLLGKSETTSPAAHLFTSLGKQGKLYSRKPVRRQFFHIVADRNEKISNHNNYIVGKEPGRDEFQKNADEILLSKYSPPGVVVNDQMEIVQFRGSTGTWLESSPGKPSLNVLKMAREGLAFEIRNALHKVKAGNKSHIKENIPIQFMGHQRLVTLEVIPLLNTAEPFFLILFQDTNFPKSFTGGLQKEEQPDSKEIRESFENVHIKRLEDELAQAREDMRSITEDQEAANEELQSANEELLSGSEELQSLNEELETSKEEIQSTNEELITLNQELFDRNEQLNISRLYAESIVSTIREPLIILNKNIIVKTANRSYYNKFKTTEEETEGKSFFELENGQWNIPSLHSMLGNISFAEDKISDFEIKHTFAISGERTMLLNAKRIFRDSNTEQLILLAIEDVTEAKKLEEDQKNFTRQLEHSVEDRTSELKMSNVSLKHSNENLEQFATIASHDLQEPLRKIRTFANILSQRHSEGLSDEIKKYIEKINSSAERMSALINDVLNFSKILESERVYEKTNLNTILEHVVDDFDLLITQKKAVINKEHLPVLDAIPIQINQLFYNLMSNALKFTNTDLPPVIDITSRLLSAEEMKKHPSLSENKTYYEIVFQDNGIGFNEEFSEQIFLIFQRLHSKDHFEGTGIGLALCKRIVINHHGEIYATNKKDKGARFHIILPTLQ